MTLLEIPRHDAAPSTRATPASSFVAGRASIVAALGVALSACEGAVNTLLALLDHVVPTLAPSATVAWLDGQGGIAYVAMRSCIADDAPFTEILAPADLPSAHFAMLRSASARGAAAHELPVTDGALRLLPLVQGGRLLGALWIDGELSPLGTEVLDDVADRAGTALATAGLVDALHQETARRESAERRLLESDRRKDEFLAMLAHELRNPLAPIRNAIEVIRLVAPPDAKLQWATDVTDRQVRVLCRLVDELLDAARLNEGKIALEKESVDVVDLVSRSVETHRAAIAARGQTLSVSLPGFAVDLDGDVTRLAQVVDELLQNAVKYTPIGGSIAVEVSREDAADGSVALIAVRDDGIGIDAALLPRVFELFEQGERALDRQQGGLGIGLTLVRRLVSLHGGVVQVSSEGTGLGARFTVRLPCLSEVTGPGDRVAAAPHVALQPAPRRRVLVVEDNPDVAESTTLLLSLSGHEVRWVADGLQALQVAADFAPEIVLLDIGLPLMDGYEVARRLRAMAATCTSRLFALTGYGQAADRRRGEEAGFDGHLMKPADPAKLAELMAW